MLKKVLILFAASVFCVRIFPFLWIGRVDESKRFLLALLTVLSNLV